MTGPRGGSAEAGRGDGTEPVRIGRWLPVLLCAGLLLQACASSGRPAPEATGSPTPTSAGGDPVGGDVDLVPVGYGTLRQDEVTLSLRDGPLLIKVTPLAEWVIRLTAPDTYQRLAGLRRAHRRGDDDGSGSRFLVSFFSYEPSVDFQPEDVHLVNRGLRLRPREIRPVTPGWGVQRLRQEETQMAVYAYGPDVDLEQELSVEYRDATRRGWDRILQTLQAEEARARARARSDTASRR